MVDKVTTLTVEGDDSLANQAKLAEQLAQNLIKAADIKPQ